MGTDLLNRPDGEERTDEPNQSVYDDKFNDIIKRNYGNSDDDQADRESPESLKKAEEEAADNGARTAVPAAEESATKAEEPADDTIGSGYQDEGSGRGLGGSKNLLKGKSNRKRLVFGGAAAGGITALIVAGFMALMPLKLISIVENLQQKYFAQTTTATERWNDKLYSDYMKKHVLPRMGINGRCTTTRASRSCAVVDGTQGKLGNLYRAWRDSNLEGNLATKYGMTFERAGNTWTLNMRGESPITLGADFLEGGDTIGDRLVGSRAEFRSKYKEAFNNETRFKKVMYRVKVGKLLERKYGIKRCAVACNLRDRYADFKDRKSMAFKALLIRRVVEPKSTFYAFAFTCVLSGNCSNFISTGADGERRTAFESQVADQLNKYLMQFSEEGLEEVFQTASKIIDKGFFNYLISEVITKVFSKELADKAVNSAIPVVGWINFAANTIELLKKGVDSIIRMRYVLLATTAVSSWMLARSHVDEIKSGVVDSEYVASFSSALGDETLNNQPAENSPVFSELMGSTPSASSSTYIKDLFPSAFAQSTDTTNQKQLYTCNDGKEPRNGLKVCPEERADESGLAGALSNLFDAPGLKQLEAAAKAWTETFGRVINAISGAVGTLLGAVGLDEVVSSALGYITSPIENQLKDIIEPFMNRISSFLFPALLTGNDSGARVFNAMALGANISGQEFAHYSLGGRQLTDQEMAQIRNQVEQEEQVQFARLPLRERLFSKTNTRSMISRVAIATPSKPSTLAYSTASTIMNPFRRISTSFAMFANPQRANAQTAEPDPFGVTQFGIPVDDPVYNTDLDTLTDEYCATFNDAWYKDVTKDPNTGIDIHKRVNPCLLHEATIASAGGYFTDSVFSPKDLTSTITDTNILINDPSSCPTTIVPINQTTLVNGTFRVHSCISGNLKRMLDDAAAAGVSLSVSGPASTWRDINDQVQMRIKNGCSGDKVYDKSCIGSPPTAIPGTSMHERGLAIDFANIGECPQNNVNVCQAPMSKEWVWLSNNAERYGFKQLPAEAWHWSTSGS